MTAIQVFHRTGTTAYSTAYEYLEKVYRFLSHPRAIESYRWLWQAFCCACFVAVALGTIARIECDALVEKHLEQPPVVEPTAAPSTPLAASEDEQLPEVVEEPSEETQPVPEAGELPNYQEMTAAQLRSECSRLGVIWRDAHGKGRHLKKPEMIAALQ